MTTSLQQWAATHLGIPVEQAPVWAISVRQPWAWAIAEGGKNIENRVWRSFVSGWAFLHVAKFDTAGYWEAMKERILRTSPRLEMIYPHRNMLKRGGVIGAIKVSPSIHNSSQSDNPWAFLNEWGIPISEFRRLPFLPCKGQLRWFKPKAEIPQ